MMRETLKFLASPVRGLQATVYVLAASAFLSSLLALLRDRFFAHTFGAGTELDLYYAAFRIPDLLFVTIGSLVSVYVLIPELFRRSSEKQKGYIDTVVIGFSLLAVVTSVIAAIFTPSILEALFPSLTAKGFLPTLTLLTRIMLLQPIFLGLSNILASITQARGRYLLYAVTPLLYNIGIILGLLVFYPVFGITGLAYGVVLGAALHLGVQVPSIVADGFFRSLPRFGDMGTLFHTAAISLPRALALSMNQIAFTGLASLASGLSAGSITVFMFAFNLMSVPLAVIGASYSVAAFPTLASALAEGRTQEFVEYVSTAARYILFWSLPSIGLIIVLRAHLVRVVLGSGSFDWTDTRLTAAVFALLSISLAAQAIVLLLARAYYAAGRTFMPFTVALCSMIATLGLAQYFTSLFTHTSALQYVQHVMRLDGVSGSLVLSLPLAFSVASIIGAIALIVNFESRFGGFLSRISMTLAQGFLASVAAALAAYAMLVVVGPLTLSSTLLSVFLRGFAGGVAGIAAAVFIYMVFRNREYQETVAIVHGKLWRTPLSRSRPIASVEEISPSSP